MTSITNSNSSHSQPHICTFGGLVQVLDLADHWTVARRWTDGWLAEPTVGGRP